MKGGTAEEFCKAHGFHRFVLLAGPGYDKRKIYRCEDCLAETDRMLVEGEE
jgi:hypothetical protein